MVSNSERLFLIYVQNKLNSSANVNFIVGMNNSGKVKKVLGLFLRNDKDEFIFEPHLNGVGSAIINSKKLPTKRELLSMVISVFDLFLESLLTYWYMERSYCRNSGEKKLNGMK